MPGHADPREALIRAALQLRRAGTGIVAAHDTKIRDLFDEIAAEIARIDPTGPARSTYRQQRMDRLLRKVEKLTRETFGEWEKGVESDVARLGRLHGQQITADLAATVGAVGVDIKPAVPTQNMIKAVLRTNPFGSNIEKDVLSGWVELERGRTMAELTKRFRAGMVEEWSIGRFVEELRGGMPGRKAIITNTRRSAEAIVRSAVTHVASEAQMLTYEANPRIVAGVQYTATLDSLTCLKCAPLDGKVWDVDSEDIIRPPVHIQCRCSLVPVVDWDALGLDPPEDGERFARDQKARLEGKGRAAQRTQVPASTNYEEWLRSQDPEVVRDILGPGRAKLFLDGDTDLGNMIGRDRRILTLDEMEAA